MQPLDHYIKKFDLAGWEFLLLPITALLMPILAILALLTVPCFWLSGERHAAQKDGGAKAAR